MPHSYTSPARSRLSQCVKKNGRFPKETAVETVRMMPLVRELSDGLLIR